MGYNTKLQINKKVTDVKSAIFAVADSLNFYIEPESLKDLNVPKIADQIVTVTRRQYGDSFIKANLEQVLNQTIKNMTTTAKTRTTKPTPSAKNMEISEADQNIVNSTESFNKKISQLQHLWGHPAVLSKAFEKSRQRVINAIAIAKKKMK